MGFMPISNQQTDSAADGDIPLTKVPTASSTGARRPLQSLDGMASSSQDTDEKHGLFHRRGPAGRRRAQKESLVRSGTGDSELALNFMGKVYTKIIGASVVTRYLVYVVPVALLLAIPIVLLPVTGNRRTIPLGTHPDPTDPAGDPIKRPQLFLLIM